MDRINAVLLLFGSVGTVVGILKLALYSQRRSDHARRLWELVAERVDGRIEGDERQSQSGSGLKVVTRIDGVLVTVEACREASPGRRAAALMTQVRAGTAGLAGLRLQVSPEGLLDQMTKALGAQDVTIGDEPFDVRYVIKATNADLARVWLSEAARRGISSCHPYRFELSQGEVRATCRGLEVDAKRLERVIYLVASLTQEGSGLLRETRRMSAEIGGLLSARADGWEPDGGVLIVVERQGAQVLVDFTCRPAETSSLQTVLTRVRVRSLVNGEARFVIHGQPGCVPPAALLALPLVEDQDREFSGRFTLLSDDAEGMLGRLSTSLRQRIRGLSPALVTGDGREVTVLLGGLVLEAAAVSEAIDLALELASGEPAGPYR